MVHIGTGGEARGRAGESIEGVSEEIHVGDQFDQSSRNLTGDYFWYGIFFFSEKPSSAQFPLSPFFFLGKKAPGQILTGLVELVVDIDSARFHLNEVLRVWRVDCAGLDPSQTLVFSSFSLPLKNFFFKKENFLKGTGHERGYHNGEAGEAVEEAGMVSQPHSTPAGPVGSGFSGSENLCVRLAWRRRGRNTSYPAEVYVGGV